MTEILESVGVDPDGTPVDQLPEHGAWALVGYFNDMNEESNSE